MKRHATTGVVVIALAFAGCGGDGEKAATTPTPVATPDANALPPELLECMAEQGYELSGTGDIHSAPPQILQFCFESLHRGG